MSRQRNHILCYVSAVNHHATLFTVSETFQWSDLWLAYSTCSSASSCHLSSRATPLSFWSCSSSAWRTKHTSTHSDLHQQNRRSVSDDHDGETKAKPRPPLSPSSISGSVDWSLCCILVVVGHRNFSLFSLLIKQQIQKCSRLPAAETPVQCVCVWVSVSVSA